MKVIKIGALWCSGCLVMKPRWQEIEKENPWLQNEYYDYDDNTEVMEKYGLIDATLPVFIFLDNQNNEILRLAGEIGKKELIETINEYKDK